MHSIVRVGDPDKGLARLQRQQELIFDMGWNVGQHVVALSEKDPALHDRLMDHVEGSRGLFFDHVAVWVKEFDKNFQTRGEAARETYLEDIDIFTKVKFEALVESVPPAVVSVQVIPVGKDEGGVVPHFYGPNDATTGWAIYERGASGLATWVADARDETTAMFLGAALANQHGVHIEPQPWKEKA